MRDSPYRGYLHKSHISLFGLKAEVNPPQGWPHLIMGRWGSNKMFFNCSCCFQFVPGMFQEVRGGPWSSWRFLRVRTAYIIVMSIKWHARPEKPTLFDQKGSVFAEARLKACWGQGRGDPPRVNPILELGMGGQTKGFWIVHVVFIFPLCAWAWARVPLVFTMFVFTC